MRKLADDIWVHEDEMDFPGTTLSLRMTIIHLSSGKLWIHSPTKIGDALISAIAQLGEVGHIDAAGNAHYLFVLDWVAAFPKAELYLSAGIPGKLKLTERYEPLDAGSDTG